MIFAEPARLLAQAVAATAAVDILETAAGTGVLTRALARLDGREIVATDLNEPMPATAAKRAVSDRVRWQVADARQLPFAECSFDLVACQFGVIRGRGTARPVRQRRIRRADAVVAGERATTGPSPRDAVRPAREVRLCADPTWRSPRSPRCRGR
ncbi:class I SAM-dependent methyltransferase [Nocardia africana]